MIYRSFLTASLLFVLATASAILANNNLFLPGDSYFPTVLTQQDIATLRDKPESDRTFEYSSFDAYPMAFCGDAGFPHVRFSSVDDRFIANLQAVYENIREWQPRELREERENGTKKLVETNGIRVLFYRSDFPFPGGQLGLRYNENWASEAVRFGHQRAHLRLCSLIPHPDAIAISWRDASVYPGLILDPSDAVRDRIQHRGKPVTVTDDVKAFVIATYDLQDFFRPADRFLRLYVVDANGFKELHLNDGQWGPPDDTSPF